MACKSLTNLYVPSFFLVGKRGVPGESLGTKERCHNRCRPSPASRFLGHGRLFGMDLGPAV